MVELNSFLPYGGQFWKERNNRCFQNITKPMQKVTENCISTVYCWCKEKGIDEVEQLVDFLGSL